MRRNGQSALALPVSLFMATVWVVVACGLGGSSGTPAPSSLSSPAPQATLAATAAAGTIVVTSPAATTPATPPAAAGSSGQLDPNQPPPGLLSGGVDPVQGLLGAYCWTSNGVASCADSVAFTDREPDLPLLTVTAAATQLRFSLGDQYPFESWSANYIDDNGNVVPLGENGASFDPDAIHASSAPVAEATFNAPPAGNQSIVQVFVRFTAGGDASYGWNVTVP